MLGHKRIPSREGGIEIVVEELATRMVTLGHKVTCYNRSGHHVSGKDFDGGKRKAYKGVRLKSVLTLDKKGLAAMTASVSGAICAAFGKYDVVHFHVELANIMVHLEEKYYRKAEIEKKNGGMREILIPAMKLRIVQRWILKNILYNIRVSDYAMGFRKKYSIATNAKIHTGKKCVVNMDLKDFFPSITQKQVFQIFYYYGYTIDVSYLLSRLCTHEGRVPQGAPTSPYLSNIICLKLDKRLSKLAEKYEADYTRYADDITFSGGAGLKSIILRVKEIIEDEGFVVNEKKTRIQFDYQGQEVTGINVSGEKITVNKRYKKKIFQEIYYCKKYGPSNHLKHVGCDKRFYKEHMYGKAYFVHMIEPDIGKEILRQLDEIRWEE